MVNGEPSLTKPKTHILTFAVIVALGLLILDGWANLILRGKIDAVSNQRLPLKYPLSNIPREIIPWVGQDVLLDERVRQATGDEEYLNRTYVNKETGHGASVYIGYIGRPRSRFGHRPDVCFPAQGYEKASEKPIMVPGKDGLKIPCILYEFLSPQLGAPRVLVAATYLINGKYINDSNVANDYNVRNPNLFGKQKAYIARVQVSMQATGSRNSDVQTLCKLSGQIFENAAGTMPFFNF